MKIKKLLATFLSTVFMVGMIGVFTSCDDNGDDNQPTPAVVKEYQLLGSFESDLGFLGKGYEFMLNLKKSGDAVLNRYNPYTCDDSESSANSGYEGAYMSGSWKKTQNDGADCLAITLQVTYLDGSSSDRDTYYAYETNGTYSFDFTFPVYPQGPKETVTMSGSGTKVYADSNAFIQAKKRSFEEPENVLKVVGLDGKGNESNITVYFKKDGSFVTYSKYMEFGSGTYTKNTDSFAVTFDGEEVEVTLNGTEARFLITYKYIQSDMLGQASVASAQYTIVVSDFTKLPDIG